MVLINYEGFFVKKLLLTFFGILFATPAYSQGTQELIGQIKQIYGANEAGGSSSLIGGFSVWGILGGIVFGTIGFAAFIYGKKNAQYKPMLIGIALMAYPYFFKGTAALYIIGIGLCAALYFFRD